MSRVLEYSGTLAAGKTLVINCDDQLATNDGANAMAGITGDWILIDAGNNEIDYEDDEVSRDVTVVITWEPRWV